MNRLKELRESLGVTQDYVASKLNVGRNTISRYENGEREPDINMLQKISDIFGVTTDYLLKRSDIPNLDQIIVKTNPNEPFTDLDKLPQDAQDKIIEYYQMMVAKHLGD